SSASRRLLAEIAVSDAFSWLAASRREDSLRSISSCSLAMRARNSVCCAWASACFCVSVGSAAQASPAHKSAQQPNASRMLFPCLALVGDRGHRRFDFSRIAKIVVADGTQVVVELIYQRLTGRDVQVHDV